MILVYYISVYWSICQPVRVCTLSDAQEALHFCLWQSNGNEIRTYYRIKDKILDYPCLKKTKKKTCFVIEAGLIPCILYKPHHLKVCLALAHDYLCLWFVEKYRQTFDIVWLKSKKSPSLSLHFFHYRHAYSGYIYLSLTL